MTMDRPQRNTLARLLAVMAVVAVIAVVLIATRPSSDRADPTQADAPPAGTPETAVAALVEAQRRGDVVGYLDRLTGRLRDEMTARRETESDAELAAGLRGRLSGLKGRVTSDVDQTGDRATLTLELIFADRNERERVELVREDGEWKITARDPLDRFEPEIPYGTPVAAPVEER
ncbi:MAG: hypothetical protein ACREJB_15690 [Planctomycetaceae bacterium]